MSSQGSRFICSSQGAIPCILSGRGMCCCMVWYGCLTVKDCRGDFFGGMWAWGVMGGLRNHDPGTPPPLGGPNTWGQVNHNQAQKGSKNFLRLRWGLENLFSLDVCNFKTLHAWMEQPHRIWTPTPCRAIGCQNSRDYVRCKLLIFFCISCVFFGEKNLSAEQNPKNV